MSAIALELGQRVVFIGPPRIGKTNHICFLLQAGVESAVIFDSKRHPDEYARWGPQHGYVVTSDPTLISKYPKVILQVDQRWLLDRGGWNRPGSLGWNWTEALRRVQTRGNTVVVFDEVIQTLPAGAAHPLAVTVYTQGAAWGLSCWAGTQIPNRMETLVIRIAEHCFAFWCGNHGDRGIISNCRSCESEVLGELQRPPSARHYGYHLAGTQDWMICPSVENVISSTKRSSKKRIARIEEGAQDGVDTPEMETHDVPA